MSKDQIEQLLKHLGQALNAGDLQAVSDCWEVPGLVFSNEGAIAITDKKQLNEIFAKATESYRSQGIASTKPELERIDMLSDKLAAVDVRWPSFDKAGKEKGSERSHYILELGKGGHIGIRVALTRTQ
jgi:hypothetical protein